MPNQLNRRQFIASGAAAGVALSTAGAQAPAAAPMPQRKFYSNLALGLLGRFPATFPQTIDLAVQYGFGGVDPNGNYFASLSDADMSALKANMASKNLGFGTQNLPTNFRGGEAPFSDSLTKLADQIAPLQRAGANRLIIWITPSSNNETYLQNLTQTAYRLRQCALVLNDNGMRLGLEYVAPRTSWTRGRYPFVHTMAEMRELISAIGCPNVGMVLDSWHWFNARDTAQDILNLNNSDVVAVHLNDAPTGLTWDTYNDGQRELPAATGVIPIKDFLDALVRIGYDGPVSAEPNNAAVRAMTMDQAVAATAAAINKAFAEIGTPAATT